MGGPVAAGITYEDWFADQERSRQLEILGPGRLEMYENGNLNLSDMVNMAGSAMTLKELEGRIEDVRPVIVDAPFATFYEPMRALYDELMIKYGGDFNKVRTNMPKKNYVVCDLPPHIRKALVTKTESLWFSTDTLAKQLHNHPELTQAEYAQVFSGIKDYTGKIYDRGKGSVGLVIEVGGRYYRAILKPTLNNLEVYLVSTTSLDERHLNTFIKSKVIQSKKATGSQ